MTRIWSVACAVIVAFAVTLIAQDSQRQKPSSSSAKDVTITGCIQRATETPAGTTGTTGTTRMDTKFVLKNAMMGPASGTSTTTPPSSPPSTTPPTTTPPTTTPPAATPPAAGTSTMSSGTEYRLDADDSKLSPHVGHKVEIKGKLDETAGTSTTTMAPKLKVDSIKMISSSCS